MGIPISEDGKAMDQRNLRNRVHYRACKKAGLKRITVKDLRHSYATIRIGAGHQIAAVSKQLGHSSVNITIGTYYHWIPEHDVKEIAAIDDLIRTA